MFGVEVLSLALMNMALTLCPLTLMTSLLGVSSREVDCKDLSKY